MRPNTNGSANILMYDPRVTQTLAALPVFAKMPVEAWEGLLREARTMPFSMGDMLGEVGQPATMLFVILSGHVKVFLPMGGDGQSEGIVDVIGAGGVYGESAITGVGRAVVSAQALSDGEAVAIPGTTVQTFLNDRPDLVMAMLGALSGSLRGLLAQLTELKLKTTAQRLAMFLLQLAGRDDGPAAVDLPYSKRVIALKLGMTPETLSRALAKLEPLGVRAEGRGRIVIADCAPLADLCGFVSGEQA